MFTHDEIRAELLRQIEAGAVTQAAVARRLKTTPPRISEVVKGTRRIQPHEMSILVSFLGMTSEYEAEVHTFMPKLSLDQQRVVRDMVRQLASAGDTPEK